MAELSPDIPALFGDDSSNSRRYGEGATEAAIRVAIESINSADPLDPPQLAIAQICLSLAQSVDKGNQKGRAIANEAQQLAVMLELLRGDTTTTDTNETIPADVRALFEMAAVPVWDDPATPRDPAQP